jgi:hypothetical protein
LGAGRFLEMVISGYFNSGIAFMQCVKGFLCQFGLNADLSKQMDFKERIKDDPNWLPEGPKYWENDLSIALHNFYSYVLTTGHDTTCILQHSIVCSVQLTTEVE